MPIQNKELVRSACYINGKWIETDSKFEVKDPFDQSVITSVTDADLNLLDQAVQNASDAFKTWSKLSVYKRSELLHSWYQLIMENKDDLAVLLSMEMGKILAEARAEIEYGADYIKWFAEEAIRNYGDTIPSKNPDQRVFVLKEPVGPVAIITPWNFPNAMIARKIAPALAAGCTAVIKPAEDTPLSALALAVLSHKAGIPKGVLNVVTTQNAPEFGKFLCTDKRIKKISFTGSTEVGKILMEQSSGTLKKLSLELGGNASFTVFEDADLDKALSGLMASKFRNSGQTCVCANRILVHADILDEFVSKLRKRIEKLEVDRGTESSSKITPLINASAVEKIEALLEDAVKKGAEVLVGGKRMSTGENFFEPSLLVNGNKEMRIFKEEIFGPVAVVYSFSSDEELLSIANDTEYGLASYFFAKDPDRIWKIAEELECGMIGINTGLISNVSAPFGGVKHSGFGREGSKYGMDEYHNKKYLNWQLN